MDGASLEVGERLDLVVGAVVVDLLDITFHFEKFEELNGNYEIPGVYIPSWSTDHVSLKPVF